LTDLKKLNGEEDTRLSYSSSTLVSNCEQRYYYYKVKKVDKDKDAAARDDSHFHIGTSFHHVLEMSMHEKPEDIDSDLEYCIQNEGLKEEDKGLVHAMVLQYLRLRKGSGFKAIACEYAIEDKVVIGYVDLIEVHEESGDWFISDLKTAKTFYDSKIAELPANPQLNLYASFYKEIAKKYDLDPEKFRGCRYLVCTKSSAKQQPKETYAGYVMRMVDKKLVKAIFITIPKELMRIDATRKEIIRLHERTIELRQGAKPIKNLSYCNSFFRPCDYFSRCHGFESSEIAKNETIHVSRT